ncbi:MAG: carbamoyltransferase HypF [Nocardiopsaceae bacterium]|nr:carbamoyltransferase HypF [Nocardiopsaceae bacterium]
MERIQADAPSLASVERVTATPLPPAGTAGFTIVASASGPARTLVAADAATCADCLRELADPADRRYRYPFINCTNCGPRFTIVKDVPYDRPYTTMAPFTMCEPCAAEYQDPADRRYHAQPVCCPACGPSLTLLDASGSALASSQPSSSQPASSQPASSQPASSQPASSQPASSQLASSQGDISEMSGFSGSAVFGGPVEAAAELLRDGRVVAVKGLGGYHLAADAACEKAVAALRARKHREDKPFAILAASLAGARSLCAVDEAAAGLLTSRARPIVLLPRLPDADVAPSVAPGNRELGIMLPYTPLHHLLLEAMGRPIVLTSGNVSDEPIAYADADALARLGGAGGIADAFLTHDRAIHVRTDDSVARISRGRPMLLRRSRGYAPEPVTVPGGFPRPVLACGAELKNTFCLAKERHAFVSHHVGDLENAETLRSFTEGIEHFSRLFDISPAVVAYDLHPEYLSTKYALDLPDTVLPGIDLTGVQHHHAHIASCLADNGWPPDEERGGGPVIGVAFDGTGYGLDGTIWGGEFLVADYAEFTREGRLVPVPMPGGAAAVRQPWRMAAAYLDASGLDFSGLDTSGSVASGSDTSGQDAGALAPDVLEVRHRNRDRWAAVLGMARRGLNSPPSSGAGRLFDAVASVLGVRDAVNYEGQAAIELEQLADPAEAGAYRAGMEQPAAAGDPFGIRGSDLVRAVLEDLVAGVPRPVIAARFHNGVAAAIADGCLLLRSRHGLSTVALSGGVFQNTLLLGTVVSRLEADGFRVLTHSRVPCNDGGISLGQAAVAAARDRASLP